MLGMLVALLLNPQPSYGHVVHVCHELRVDRAVAQCSPVGAGELRTLGFDPGRDEAIAFYGRPGWGAGPGDVMDQTTIWAFLFNGERIDVVRS